MANMIEVLKQALEALEQVTKELLAVRDELAERGARPTTNVFHQRLWNSSFSAYTDHAIPAAQSLRKAIKELESQEPVAYLCENAVGHKYFRWKKPTSIYKPIALYTHPPQRTWVGLTDEEIWQIATDSTIGGDLHADKFAKAIESKLKERNG